MHLTSEEINQISDLTIFIYSPVDTMSADKFNKPLEEIINEIIQTPLSTIISIIDNGNIEYCYPRYIPQYSNLQSAIDVEINYLAENGICSLKKIGSIMPNQITDSTSAKIKYGENHSKLLEIFGLALVQKGYVQLTEMGIYFSKLDSNQRLEYVKRSVFRSPIIRNIMIKSKHQTISVNEELSLFLSKSTANRRLPNVYNLIKLLEPCNEPELMIRLSNVKR